MRELPPAGGYSVDGQRSKKLFNDMTATVFSPELQYSARRDSQEVQLKAPQQYWQLSLGPAWKQAVR